MNGVCRWNSGGWSADLKRENVLSHLGGPKQSCQSSGWKRVRGYVAGFEDGGRTPVKEDGWPLAAGKGQGRDFPLEPPGRHVVLLTLCSLIC